MKIGLDVSPLFLESHRVRGIGRYTEHLVAELMKKGPASQYAWFANGARIGFSGAAGACASGHRVPLNGLPASPLVNVAATQLLLPMAARAASVDMLHLPTHLGALAFSSCPTVVTVHDLIQHVFPREYLVTLRSRLYMAYSKMAARRSAAIITISDASRQDIERFYGVSQSKIHVIPHGVDPMFSPRSFAEARKVVAQRFKIGVPFLLYVGGFDARKNLRGLVESLGILQARYGMKRTLICVGKRPPPHDKLFKRLLHEIDRSGLRREVCFLDFVSNDDLLWLYNAAEALVFPSLYEGFGFPPLEAMACGVPVIAFRRSSIPEVVGDGGVLLDRTNGEALAEAIAEVLTNGSLRDDLRARGLRRAREFTWAKTADLTLGVYRQVIAETTIKRAERKEAAAVSDPYVKGGLR